MDVYAETILEHYRHPQGKKRLPSPTVTHEEVNHACGDALTVDLVLRDGNIAVIGWEGTGCAISQAGMSLLSEELSGMTAEGAEALTKQDMDAMLGVPIGPRRFKCALLSLHTVKNALRKWRGEEAQGWLETVQLAEHEPLRRIIT
ncbi:iron-sulfur cluster assembly scaffold protein [Candidatus Peregrinibacteria bacterium]|nr:iron-sulfur cluster assembly scaffold protein [Candidatus Peregrinibacteria bacterium]MBI3816632.1 iron-sulfur cluster assembly scaffold protein [Candidatus Peregrinibacteria bacterium]